MSSSTFLSRLTRQRGVASWWVMVDEQLALDDLDPLAQGLDRCSPAVGDWHRLLVEDHASCRLPASTRNTVAPSDFDAVAPAHPAGPCTAREGGQQCRVGVDRCGLRSTPGTPAPRSFHEARTGSSPESGSLRGDAQQVALAARYSALVA